VRRPADQESPRRCEGMRDATDPGEKGKAHREKKSDTKIREQKKRQITIVSCGGFDSHKDPGKGGGDGVHYHLRARPRCREGLKRKDDFIHRESVRRSTYSISNQKKEDYRPQQREERTRSSSSTSRRTLSARKEPSKISKRERKKGGNTLPISKSGRGGKKERTSSTNRKRKKEKRKEVARTSVGLGNYILPWGKKL